MEDIINILNEAELNEVAGGGRKGEGKHYIIYTVVKGDTLSSIAKAFNTTWRKIWRLNEETIGHDPDHVKPGMKLKIPND